MLPAFADGVEYRGDLEVLIVREQGQGDNGGLAPIDVELDGEILDFEGVWLSEDIVSAVGGGEYSEVDLERVERETRQADIAAIEALRDGDDGE
jgi:hypothetical protein